MYYYITLIMVRMLWPTLFISLHHAYIKKYYTNTLK